MSEAEAERRRDGWSKAEVVAAFVAPAATATVAALFAYWYNQAQIEQTALQSERELAVARIEAVTDLLPHALGSDAAASEAALKSIAALGDHELAEAIALAVGGPPAVATIKSLQPVGEPSGGLAHLLQSVSEGVFVARGGDGSSPQANGFVMKGDVWITSASVAEAGPPFTFVFPTTGREVAATLKAVDQLRGIAVFHPIEPIGVPVLALADKIGEEPDLLVASGFTSGGIWVAIPVQVERGDAMFVLEYPAGGPPDPGAEFDEFVEQISANLLSLPGQVRLSPPPGFDGAVILNDSGEVFGQLVANALLLGDRKAPAGSALFIPASELARVRCHHTDQDCL